MNQVAARPLIWLSSNRTLETAQVSSQEQELGKTTTFYVVTSPSWGRYNSPGRNFEDHPSCIASTKWILKPWDMDHREVVFTYPVCHVHIPETHSMHGYSWIPQCNWMSIVSVQISCVLYSSICTNMLLSVFDLFQIPNKIGRWFCDQSTYIIILAKPQIPILTLFETLFLSRWKGAVTTSAALECKPLESSCNVAGLYNCCIAIQWAPEKMWKKCVCSIELKICSAKCKDNHRFFQFSSFDSKMAMKFCVIHLPVG